MKKYNCEPIAYSTDKTDYNKITNLIHILKNPRSTCLTWIGFLIALILLSFGKSIYYDFVYYDDYTYTILKAQKGKFYSISFIKWAITSTDDGFWAPLTKLSHQIDTNIFGENSGWHHTVNLLLHIFNSILLWRFLASLNGENLLVFLASAIFAIHPLRTEPVCWIASRKDLLSTLFLLLMMIEFLKYLKYNNRKNYIMCILYFALSALSKPISMVFPLSLPLLYFIQREKIPPEEKLSSIVLKSLPFILISLFIALITIYSEKEAIVPTQFLSTYDRLSRGIISLSHYLLLTFIPAELHTPFGIDYYLFSGQKFGIPVFRDTTYLLFFIIVFIILTTIWILFSESKKTGIITYLMFLIPLLPVLGIIPFGHHLIADRFTYPSHIAFALWLTYLPKQGNRVMKMTYNIFLTIILIIFAGISLNLSSYWQNSETLFRRTLHFEPKSYVGLCNLASALLRTNRYTEAIPLLQKTTELYPNKYEPYNDLAFAYQKLGRYQDALNNYLKSLQIKPDDPEILSNISTLYLETGEIKKAKLFSKKALQINPNLENAKRILSIIENQEKKPN